MFKRIKAFINKPKERRMAKIEEVRKKLPEKSFSKKFYDLAKDVKYESIVIKIPGGKVIYHSKGKKNQVGIPYDLLNKLKAKGMNLSKLQIIHNHTIPMNSNLTIKPSVVDAKSFLNLYKEFGITNFSILLINEKSMHEFGRCFLKLDQEPIKNVIKKMKDDFELNLWFEKRTRWFGNQALYLTEGDIKNLGFTMKLQGLNGHKYNPEKEVFEKIK